MKSTRRSFEEDGVQDYLAAAGRHRLLSREEEIALFQRVEAGDQDAREELAACNLRFVVKVAMRFKGLGVSLADLIQEGNIGLLTVIDKFDWRKGFRFSTYAAYYIRQEIQAALHRQGAAIRLPVRKARLLAKINETIRREYEATGVEPSVQEVAFALGLPAEKIEALMELRMSFASMDAEIGEDGMRLGDLIADESAPSPDERISREQTRAAVGNVLSYLTDRERQVIELRFGLGAKGRAHSLRKASKMIGLSQEGVRRVEHRALGKLRRPAISAQIAGLSAA